MKKTEFVNSVKIGGLSLVRGICGQCGRNALCTILKFKKRRRWQRSRICTACLPIHTDVDFDDGYMVMRKEDAILLAKMLKDLTAALLKIGVSLYAIKSKEGKVGKRSVRDIAVGFSDEEA